MGVNYEGVTEILFCEKGVKITEKVFQDTILKVIVMPLNVKLISGQDWNFQQNNAETKDLPIRNLDFISLDYNL